MTYLNIFIPDDSEIAEAIPHIAKLSDLFDKFQILNPKPIRGDCIAHGISDDLNLDIYRLGTGILQSALVSADYCSVDHINILIGTGASSRPGAYLVRNSHYGTDMTPLGYPKNIMPGQPEFIQTNYQLRSVLKSLFNFPEIDSITANDFVVCLEPDVLYDMEDYAFLYAGRGEKAIVRAVSDTGNGEEFKDALPKVMAHLMDCVREIILYYKGGATK